jgi:hypothetical protein
MLPAAEKDPLAGSYISALAVALALVVEVSPPAISIWPLASGVALCRVRAVVITPAALNVPDAGS